MLIAVVSFEGLDTNVLGETHLHKLFHLLFDIFLLGIVLHPLFRSELVQLPISLILACNLSILWIIWLGTAEKCLQRNERGSDSERRRPLILENIEADGSGLRADIWMPYLRIELHLGWLEGVVGRDVDVHIEDASLVACVFLQA